VLIVVCVALATGAGGWLVGSRITSPADATAAHQPPPASAITVAVERKTLSSTVIAQGTVTYTGATPLTLTGAVGSPPGTEAPATQIVTRAPAAGTTLRTGDRLMEISGRPVFVLPGSVPMYRTLADGAQGQDVRQLQAALSTLGFGRLRGGIFDAATAAAVNRWYERAGYEPQATGDTPPKFTVPSGEVLFLNTLPVRLDAITTRPGAAATGQIGTATDSAVIVQGALPSADGHLVHSGLDVTLTLPDGTTLPGTLDIVGRDAAPPPSPGPVPGAAGGTDAQSGGSQDSPGSTPLRLSAKDPAALAGFAGQSVKIGIEVGRTNGDVLTVPIAAVVTGADGTARVQLARAGGRFEDVPVKLGLSAQGVVEVSGTLGAGDRVVVGSQ
jgi:hypothetical protein